MKEANQPFEIVVPKATIFSEHPAVVIDKNVTPGKRAIIDEFMRYLWSDEAQQAFVKYHFNSTTNEAFNQANKNFGPSRCRLRSNILAVGIERIRT